MNLKLNQLSESNMSKIKGGAARPTCCGCHCANSTEEDTSQMTTNFEKERGPESNLR